MKLEKRKVLVVGMAKTGVASAAFLLSRGAEVTITDMRREEEFSGLLSGVDSPSLRKVFGRHEESDFIKSDLIVVSPGVPQDHPLLQKAKDAGIEIISEIELASRFINAPLIAITGTNGKTTTTMLAGEIFKANGFRTFVGGNIGNPLLELPASDADVDRVVVEISSFQLEWIKSFRPAISMLLNLSEDHLDRYPSYRKYLEAKLRIFKNQTEDDFAVLNRDDPLVWENSAEIRAAVIPFSRKMELEEGIFSLKENRIIWRHGGMEHVFEFGTLKLHGVHNLENIMAAMASSLLLGCRSKETFDAVREFSPLHHRMEFVRKFKGVSYFEDSKATNVGSVVKALESFDNITLIAGGKDKGGSYAPLVPLIQERVRHLVLIGEAAERMQNELGALTDTHRAGTMEEAVWLASQITAHGGTVLLSPACSSFDMFRDYEERAESFIRSVNRLKQV